MGKRLTASEMETTRLFLALMEKVKHNEDRKDEETAFVNSVFSAA